jgi:hypothetical protein
MDFASPVITLVSVAAAIYAWATVRRLQRREQERSDARVAALSEAAGRPAATRDGWAQVDGEWHWAAEVEPKRDGFAHREPENSFPAERIEHFFGTVEREPSSGSRLPLVAAAALIVLLGGALVFLNTSTGDQQGTTVARVAHQEPLELVSLAHNRDAKMLTITGMVRNPATGPKLEGLTAVVTLLDTAGTLVSTKDVPLDYRALGPGEEAPFKISIPDPGAIARYRVSFRAGTDVVPHVDRRSNTKLASALN